MRHFRLARTRYEVFSAAFDADQCRHHAPLFEFGVKHQHQLTVEFKLRYTARRDRTLTLDAVTGIESNVAETIGRGGLQAGDTNYPKQKRHREVAFSIQACWSNVHEFTSLLTWIPTYFAPLFAS